MSHLRLLFLAIAAVIAVTPSVGQHNPNRSRNGSLRYMFGDGVNISDSVEVYKTLINNTPVDKDFINDPIFAIVGKNKSFYFSIGANFKFVGSYD